MPELRHVNWGLVLRGLTSRLAVGSLVRHHSLQWFLTLGLREAGIICLNYGEDGPITILKNGIFYDLEPNNYQHIFTIHSDYPMDKIRKDDVVLDIGANVGSFTLEASRRARMVYAVEPLFSQELEGNIRLNSPTNVKVLSVGLGGFNKESLLEYEGVSRKIRVMTFNEILSWVGEQVTFLKLDCEGPEWTIPLVSLIGIRCIVGEMHYCNGYGRADWKRWSDWFEASGYTFKVTKDYKYWIRFWAERSG